MPKACLVVICELDDVDDDSPEMHAFKQVCLIATLAAENVGDVVSADFCGGSKRLTPEVEDALAEEFSS